MKILIFIFSTICIVNIGAGKIGSDHLLGAKECTWGPSYWCKNLTAAASCHATKHCIQTVWMHLQLPEDSSSICQTCLDMVKQARDNLLSNETQDLIKQVFEGTCSLVHFKPIVQECDKIVDDFIPDLIDTLASQMNPQVVCSVAGLCNNEEYLKTLEPNPETPGKPGMAKIPEIPELDMCKGCKTVVDLMEKRFESMPKDGVLQGLLMMCREMSSYSDACSNVILTYFNEIYGHLKTHLKSNEVCVLSGQCSLLFHQHDEQASAPQKVEVTSNSNIGFVKIGGAVDPPPDIPCELCEQLVRHLRDLLVANTTEEEFKKVLEGLCKQTKSFSDECLSIVDEHYDAAYKFLLGELNATMVCGLIGICPQKMSENVQIAPLLPSETVKILEITPKTKLARIPLTKSQVSVKIVNPNGFNVAPSEQIPIDFLNSPLENVMFNKEMCEICQFFLHFVQQEITSDATEDEIKKIIEEGCDKLPGGMNATCDQFVETYEPALVALLAQEIDPSQICPLIRVCPAQNNENVEVFMSANEAKDNGKCPLCLFAVQKLEEMVKDKKTEDDIRAALDKLCSKLSDNLAKECLSFVDTYTEELVELLLADLNPKEVCVYLKLCTDTKPAPAVLKPVTKFEPVAQPETNAILDSTFNGVEMGSVGLKKSEVRSPECVLCKFIMTELHKILGDNKTEVAVQIALEKVCEAFPDPLKNDCDQFVTEYAHTVFAMLEIVTVPTDICPMMQLCGTHQAHLDNMKVEIFECPVCEAAVWAMERILANPRVDHEMKHVLEKTCRALPSKDQEKCREIIEKYGTEIFDLIEHMANKNLICRKIGICAAGNKVTIL